MNVKRDEKISARKITLEASEDFKDSLEIVPKCPIHGSDKLKSDSIDAVELDSLEITKFDAIKLKDSTTAADTFYPFAKVGTNWSNDGAAQNSITATYSDTKQDVENNTTSEVIDQTNSNSSNSLSTNQDSDEEYRELPGD